MAGGQKERLGEVREAQDEAAGRQYAMKASVPAYSDLTACHPPSLSSPTLLRQPPKEATGNTPMESLTRKALGRARGRGRRAARSVRVGVGVLPLDALIIAVTVLLVTPA